MPSIDDLIPVAEESAFIFSGSIVRAGASTVATVPVSAATVVVSVEEVIKAPPGLRGFSGSEVTVRLRRPLEEGNYVFFARPAAVGAGIAVTEVAHLEGTAESRREAVAAVERGYAAIITRRAEAAVLVALGTIGPITQLLPPVERQRRGPWATAPFETERVIKGGKRNRRVTLIGPNPPWKRLPRTPGLRAGIRAILFLHHPPGEAIELLVEEERQSALFIADTSDVQPPERLETILQILRGAEKE
jgi:hypothetical protein